MQEEVCLEEKVMVEIPGDTFKEYWLLGLALVQPSLKKGNAVVQTPLASPSATGDP